MTIFMDSFQYDTAAISRKWTNLRALSIVGGSGIATAAELYGRKLRMYSQNAELEKFLGASATWSMSFPFMLSRDVTATRDIVAFRDGATTQVTIFLENDRYIYVKRGVITHSASSTAATTGGTAITGGVATTPLEPDVWYQIEIKATFSASLSADAFQVRITGPGMEQTITLAAGQSTLTSANAWADRIALIGNGAGIPRGGDYGAMYIDNAQAALLGNVRVSPLFPDGNGNSSQWLGSDGNSVDNYLLADEATPDDDTTHVATATNALLDLYSMTNFPTPATSVLAVQWNAQARKTDAADAYIEPAYRIGATNYLTAPIMVGNAYHNLLRAVDVSPATATAWTQAEIEAMEVGFRSSL